MRAQNRVPSHRPVARRNDFHNDLNGSRTTNTSTNVSPSFNDNNSRTVLLSSDDIRSPQHRHHQQRRQPMLVNTDSNAEYDEVASRSTVDDTTPQTTSESASISEVPSESRFKTFVKQKKSKMGSSSVASSSAIAMNNRYNKHDLQVSEDTDGEPSARLLDDRLSDESQFMSSNGCNNREVPKRVSSLMANGVDSARSTNTESDEDNQEAEPNIQNTDVGDEEDDDEVDCNDNNDEEGDEHDHDTEGDDEDDEDEGDDEEAEEGVYDLSEGHVTGVQMT